MHPSISQLLDALADADAAVRWEAAKALSDLGDRRAVPPLIALVRGPATSGTRTAAAYALGWLCDPHAVASLVRAVRDSEEDPELRGYAAEALAYIGNHRAVPALVAALDDAEPVVRYWSAFALGQLGDRRAIPALERLAASDATPGPYGSTIGEEARDALMSLLPIR